MLLGRSVWSREGKQWTRVVPEERGGTVAQAVDRLAEILSGQRPRDAVVVFEPAAMAHQLVETPNVSRSVFASLARIRSEHPVVVSEGLGWGIEKPELAPGGTFSTLMHYELAPGIARLREACTLAGTRLRAVWSAYTAAAACVCPKERPQAVRHALFLLPGFVAVASCAGNRRSFKAWADRMSERDWKVFVGLAGDIGARPSLCTESEAKRPALAVIAEGSPEEVCPVWDQVVESGKIEFIAGLDALAAAACRIPHGHPGNLAEAFPAPRRLDTWAIGVGVAGVISAIALAHGALGQKLKLAESDLSGRVRAAALAERLSVLDENKAEITKLRNELPGDVRDRALRVHQILGRLAADIPDELTLTALTLGKENRFWIEAVLVGSGFNAEEVRRALSHDGFRADPLNGWTLDASSGNLSVGGRIEARGE